MAKKVVSIDLDISDLFETQEQRKLGIAAFMGLRRSQGWQLIVKSLQTSIDNLTEQILSGQDGEQTSTEGKLYYRNELINRRKAYKGIIDLPDYFIEKLKDEAQIGENLDFLDPYDPQVDTEQQ